MIGLDKKRELIEELLSHLDHSQGGDLKSMIDAAKAPKDMAVESVEVMKPKGDADMKADDAIASQDGDMDSGLESNEPSDMPGDDKELSDDELAEMLEKYLGK